MKVSVTANESSSATIIENQTPSIPDGNIRGKIMTVEVWKTIVRKNEIIADIPPLLSAVKKDEPKMLKPANR